MENKRKKIIRQQPVKRCKFMPKMQENTFGGRTPPGPVGGAYAVRQTGLPTSNGAYL